MDPAVWERWQVVCKKEFDLKHTIMLFGERYMFEKRVGVDYVRLLEEIIPKKKAKAQTKFTEEDKPGLFPPGAAGNPKGLPIGKPQQLHDAIFEVYMCECCMVEISSAKMETQHLSGKRHQQRKAQKEAGVTLFPSNATPKKKNKKKNNDFAPYICDVCNVTITSARLETDHMGGKNHKRRKLQQQQIGAVPPPRSFQCKPATAGTKPPLVKLKDGFMQYVCQACDIVISSAKMETAHNAGKRHQRNLTLKGAKVNFVAGAQQTMNGGQAAQQQPYQPF